MLRQDGYSDAQIERLISVQAQREDDAIELQKAMLGGEKQ